MTVSIDPVGRAHAAVLAALHAESFTDAWTESDLAALLDTPGTRALLASDGGAPQGFILVRLAADEAEVLTLAVAPPARRGGLGGRLLDAAVADLGAAGAAALFLEVAADNAPALALYAGRGFATVGTRRGYYARPGGAVDARVLRRDLVTSGE